MEPLDIHTAMDGPSALLRVEGELDASTAPVLDDALRRAAAEGAKERLVLDFANLTFVDSAGLSVLVAAHKRLQRDDTELVISSPSAAVRRLFDIAGLDRVLTITE